MSEQQDKRTWSVEKRLEFIEFRLFWEGSVQRADISEHFGISTPQASADISLYKERAPENLRYDSSAKRYVAADGFEPVVYRPDPGRYLSQLRTIKETVLDREDTFFGALPEFDVLPVLDRAVDAGILRAILRAIRYKSGIAVEYQSMNDERPAPVWREISPHALGSDGLRWHVRAYCHIEHRYKDFILSRILQTGELLDAQKAANGDESWHTTFDVVLVPHPSFSAAQKRVIELDYGMKNGKCIVSVRRALLYYFNKRMRLDIAAKHDRPKETPVVVENRAEFEAQLGSYST